MPPASPLPRPSPNGLGLTLSGGGFRATLFHLGVIRFLFDIQRLHEVRQICSVSGGSIMAAHLVLHWNKYTDYTPGSTAFDDAAAEIVRFVKQDVRGNIERRLYLRGVVAVLWGMAGFILIPHAYYRLGLQAAWVVTAAWALVGVASVLRLVVGRRGRTDLLQRWYDALYRVEVPSAGAGTWFQQAVAGIRNRFGTPAKPRQATRAATSDSAALSQFAAEPAKPRQATRAATAADLSGPGAPDLRILATSLTTNEKIAFDHGGLICNDQSVVPPTRLTRNQLPLSLMVGASSAFPPFFPPVLVDHRVLGCRPGKFRTRHRLTDGGIYDNLGLEDMLATAGPLDLVVVSDAENPLDLDESTFGSTTGRNFRATYILMERVGEYVRVHARAVRTPVECKLSNDNIGAEAGLYATPTDLQTDTGRIRTDLDGFSDIEVHLLVSHGYAAARVEWMHLGHDLPKIPSGEPWSPIDPVYGLNVVKPVVTIPKRVREGWKGLRWHPWNAREGTNWLCVGLAVLAVLLAALWPVEYSRTSELTSEVTLLKPNDPVYPSNPWLLEHLAHLLPADAEGEYNLIKVKAAPRPGCICARPLPPMHGQLFLHSDFDFKGFVVRFRTLNNAPVAVALLPIGSDEGTVFDLPQAPDADDEVFILGLLTKHEGEFPEETELHNFVSLRTRR